MHKQRHGVRFRGGLTRTPADLGVARGTATRPRSTGRCTISSAASWDAVSKRFPGAGPGSRPPPRGACRRGAVSGIRGRWNSLPGSGAQRLARTSSPCDRSAGSGEVRTAMARATGLEPATSGVTGRHSNRLSYARAWRRGRRRLGSFKGASPRCQAMRGPCRRPPYLTILVRRKRRSSNGVRTRLASGGTLIVRVIRAGSTPILRA